MLSCPEVCRQLLLDPIAMQTEVTALDQRLPFTSPPSAAMATLHSLSIHVLAATDIPVEIRLWLIGMLIHRDPAQLSHEDFLDQVAMLAEGGGTAHHVRATAGLAVATVVGTTHNHPSAAGLFTGTAGAADHAALP